MVRSKRRRTIGRAIAPSDMMLPVIILDEKEKRSPLQLLWSFSLVSSFDYSLDFQNINFRASPELYRIGKGEQGVLLIEPYKSEILPYWRFKTPAIAKESSEKIYQMFLEYLERDDFVGADMARKFLQMGYTRARRYANHKSGRKYRTNPQKAKSEAEKQQASREILPYDVDPLKAESAAIFKQKWLLAKNNEKYRNLLVRHQQMYEQK